MIKGYIIVHVNKNSSAINVHTAEIKSKSEHSHNHYMISVRSCMVDYYHFITGNSL